MALGPGKYDQELTDLRTRCKAAGALLIVIDGDRGSGFSAQLTPQLTLALPAVLRDLAEQIESSGIRA